MKNLIGLLIVVGIVIGIWKTWEVYEQQQTTQELAKKDSAKLLDGTRFPGMDPALENSYRMAKEKGAAGLRDFLNGYRGTPHLVDPRLGHIEIDYALLLNLNNPAEGRRVFNEVKNRILASSPLQPRVKQLEASFK
jgi:hypothetical protein